MPTPDPGLLKKKTVWTRSAVGSRRCAALDGTVQKEGGGGVSGLCSLEKTSQSEISVSIQHLT